MVHPAYSGGEERYLEKGNHRYGFWGNLENFINTGKYGLGFYHIISKVRKWVHYVYVMDMMKNLLHVQNRFDTGTWTGAVIYEFQFTRLCFHF
jgi:hypothetical protein